MVREFKLPDVGEGVAEGELVTWLVDVGDPVSEDQPVAEVETDKALVEVPSPVNGTVRELRAEEGEIMAVGEVFITFDVEGEEAEPVETEPEETGEAEPAGTPETGGAEETTDEGATAEQPSSRVFAAPSVRRLARELDIDLGTVEGTGPGGRITEADVRAAAEGGAEPDETAPAGTAEEAKGAAATTTETTTTTQAADRDRTLAAPATRRLARELGVDLNAVPATEERDGEAFVTPEAVQAFAEAGEAVPAEAAPEAEERVPYRGLRRTIGEQMERSAFTIPHVTHHELLDANGLVETRQALKSHAEDRGIRLTYLPFVIKAAIATLKSFPGFNAMLDEEAGEIIHKHYYNIGFAVATDAGLFVPVVKNTDGKGLLQLASELDELAEKARDRSIAREEMQDGTFTITNYGSVGGDYGTPIINYPEVAILGLGAIKQRPYVVDGEVVARETLPVSLTVDHRVIDGAEAAQFVAEFATYIEDPTLLLLD